MMNPSVYSHASKQTDSKDGATTRPAFYVDRSVNLMGILALPVILRKEITYFTP
jgi:hypothetical protein